MNKQREDATPGLSAEELEALEMAEDVADFDRAIAEDDGEHISLADYRADNEA